MCCIGGVVQALCNAAGVMSGRRVRRGLTCKCCRLHVLTLLNWTGARTMRCVATVCALERHVMCCFSPVHAGATLRTPAL